MKPMPLPPVPTQWSPEQALAVFEYLQQLREHIWCAYQTDFISLLGEEVAMAISPPPDDLFPPTLFEDNTDESDLPF